MGVGCSSSSSENTSAGTGGAQTSSGGTASGGSSPSASDVHGAVVVSLNAPVGDGAGYSTVIGRFFAGKTPEPLPLRLDTREGDCELLVPDLPFCSEACTPDVCIADDVCTPYPAPVGVGTISVSGLGAALSLAPATSMIVYQSPSLAYPPCDEGD